MIASPGDPLRQHEAFRVSDVRQHVYCPRITFFNYVAPVPRHRTIKMQEGSQVHLEFADLEKRRTLARYNLDEGQREFRVPLRSERLELSGVLDMLITSPSGTYPVEFKNTHGKMALHHKY